MVYYIREILALDNTYGNPRLCLFDADIVRIIFPKTVHRLSAQCCKYRHYWCRLRVVYRSVHLITRTEILLPARYLILIGVPSRMTSPAPIRSRSKLLTWHDRAEEQ